MTKHTPIKIIKKAATIVAAFFVCIACNENSNKTENTAKEIDIELGNFSLDHDTLLLSYPMVNKMVGEDSFLTFDQKSFRFVLFDFQAQKPIWQQKIEREGPNSLVGSAKDALLRNDSLFVLTLGHEFAIFNPKGERVLYFGPKEVEGLRENFRFSEVGFFGQDKIVFSKVIYSAVYPKPYDQRESIFTIFDINTREFEDLPIYHPYEELLKDQSRGFYQGVSEHFFTINDNLLVYNFRWGSTIYTYNLNSAKQASYPVQSEHIPNIREYISAKDLRDIPKLVEYMGSGPHFISTNYDAEHQLYFRGYYELVKNTAGESEKKNYLMVLDKNFEILKELEIKQPSGNDPIINRSKVYIQTAPINWPEGKNEYLEISIK